MKKIFITQPYITSSELDYVTKAIKSGWISSKGKYIKLFENQFADYCETKYGIAVSNGTAALHIALVALGIGKGDEVIIPALSYVATAHVVTYVGAKPIFVDSQPKYWCIDPNKIEEKITRKTKAIIPVHLYGHPCDMDLIIKLAKKHNLFIIEDAAEAHGSLYKNKKVGSFGDISCFSFYGNKIITTGEGGMCLTNNETIANKLRLLINHSQDSFKKYWHNNIGFNYRMTNIQAALGVAQLKKIDSIIKKRREIANIYKNKLTELINNKSIILQSEEPWAKSNFWLYTILIENSFLLSRDRLIQKLNKYGIETRPIFYPINSLPMYKKLKNDDSVYADNISLKGISIPSGFNLTLNNINYITDLVKFFNK